MSAHPLKQERESRGWSQARLAEMLGVTPRTISRWELGSVFPYPYYREQLCSIFGKDARSLGLLPDDDLPLQEEIVAGPLPLQETPPSFLHDPMVPEILRSARSLLGREELLLRLKQRLLSGESLALTALGGLPGVGKTALAAALVIDRQVQASFHDGILWAGVGPQPDVLSLLGRWGTLLGAMPPSGDQAARVEEWRQVLRTVIGTRRILLVLDDVWSIETALALQVGGPSCAYLLTTRLPQVAFAFAQEGAIPVPELAEEDGLALLGRSVPQLVAQEDEQARVLVRAVGGLPLALVLLGKTLAAQVFTGQPRRVFSTLMRLREAEQRLRVSIPTTPGEHPLSLSRDTPLSLQATIAISVHRLSEDARLTLNALAVFPAKPNSFSEEAAQAVGQMPLEALDELWDAGLLESNGPERYQIHQTIADYERIQGISPEISQRLVGFMRQYVQEQAQDYEALERELGNLLAAQDVAAALGMQQDLIEALDTLVPFLQRRGCYQQADQHLRQAYEAAVVLEDPLSQMKMLQHLALFADKLGKYQDAERYGLLGLELARQLDQLDAQSALLATLGGVATARGSYSQAILYSEQGLELARRVGASKRICDLLDRLVLIAFRQSRYTQALELAQEGLALARQQGDAEDIIKLLNDMGLVTQIQGDSDQAETFFLEALELALQLGYRELQIKLFNGLAILVGERGDLVQAEAYLLKELELGYQIGHRAHICISLANLGDNALTMGNYAKAESYLLEGVELARQFDYQGLLLLLSNLGEAVGYQGEYERANTYFEESVQLARQQNATWYLGAALASWGDIHLYCQHPDAAELAYQELLALYTSAEGDQTMLAWAYYGLARVAAGRGEIALARQLGQESLDAFATKSHYKAAEVRQWLLKLPAPQSH